MYLAEFFSQFLRILRTSFFREYISLTVRKLILKLFVKLFHIREQPTQGCFKKQIFIKFPEKREII